MISKSMARCIARISGDGYLYHRYIRYANKCPELIEEFKKDIKQEFGNVKFTEGIGNSGTPFVQIHGKYIIDQFLNYLDNYHSDKISVPKCIQMSDKDIKAHYLRAYFEDEGCVAIRKFQKTGEWKRNLTISSNSLKLLEGLKILFLEFGIISNRIIPNRRGLSKDNTYVLSITGRSNFKKFCICFPLIHPDKTSKLRFLLESYIRKEKVELLFPFVK